MIAGDAAPGSEAADAALKQAIAELQDGRTADAFGRIGRLAAHDQQSPEKSTLIGLIYLSAGDNDTALVWFDRALRLDPAHAQAWLHRGSALQQLGQAEALACYNECLRLGLQEPTLFYNRGNLLREAGRLDDAIASYDMALRLKPAYPDALRAGARILRELGHSAGALEFLDEAIRLRPDFVEALLDRGDLLQGCERWGEALASYTLLLASAPDNGAALNNRAAAFLSLCR